MHFTNTAATLNKLGCARVVNGDAKPLVGAVQANGCTSAAFVTSDAVPGFAINAVQYSPACPPGSKGCARRRRARQEGEERPEQQMEEVAEDDEDTD
ncbi:hypothetical protein PG985_014267 [Apiospora marii]|uniref:uncharacterized protein n=1 Tax=Apiospora marii TaxID=335849 RepID=UPI00312DC317